MTEVRKNLKRWLITAAAAAVLIASLLFVYFNATAEESSGTCGTNLTWEYDSDTGTLTISGYGDMTGWSKTKTPWYSYRKEITTVVFDCTDTSTGINIGRYAFSGCTGITEIDMSCITSISTYGFYNCTYLESIDLSNVTSIGTYAFCGCESLTEVTVPSVITSAVEGMFKNCTDLTKVTFLGTVTSIEDAAFYACSSLTTIVWSESDTSTGVTIPSSVTSVGTQAFYCCSSLESIVFEGTEVSFTEASGKNSSQFYQCTSLTSITLPSGQTTIPAYFLYECSALEQITIPSSVTTINKYAFCGSGLTSVTIPENVTSIEAYAFTDCENLVSVEFASGINLTSISQRLFKSCSSLSEIVLPESVTTIETYAFQDCTSLASVTFGTNLEEIAQYAFSGCTNTELELHFTGEYSSSLVINEEAFCGPSSGTGITAVAYYPADSTTWPESDPVLQEYQYGATELIWAAEGSEVEKVTWWSVSDDGTTLYIFLNGSMVNYSSRKAPWYSYCDTITEIVFNYNPDDTSAVYELTSIGNNAFYGFTALEEVTIPASVVTIGDYAFANCITTRSATSGSGNSTVEYSEVTGGLTSVAFEDGSQLTSIGDYAFYSCGWLSDIDLPDSLTAIGDYTFAGCGSELSTIRGGYVLGSGTTASVTTVSIDSSQNTLRYVYVDDVLLTEGEDYTSEIEDEQGMSSPVVITFTSDYLETLSAGVYTGYAGFDSVSSEFILYIYADDDEDADTTSTEKYDYYGLASVDLANVETIGSHAFYECCTLSSVALGDSLTLIGDNNFASCTSLKTIEFPSALLEIGTRAFADSGLVSIEIPLNVSVGSYAFSGCSSLTSVSFDSLDTDTAGSVSLSSAAFDTCTSLTEITLPSEITTLSSYLFEDCTSLVTVHFEGDLISIGTGAFEGCTALEYLEGLGSVTSIGDEAFYGCTALESLDLSESLTNDNIGDFVFYNCKSFADDNGFVVVNGVLYSYVYSVLGKDITDYGTMMGESDDDVENILIETLDVPEEVTEIANYAFYQIYQKANGTSANEDISTVTLEGLRFSTDAVELEAYALSGLYETTYIYYSCLYEESWEAALTAVGYSGSGSSLGDYRYSNSWSVTGVVEHVLSDEPDSWSWSDDHSSATASYICSACGETLEYEAVVTADKTETCTKGKTVYTAVVTNGNGATAENTETVYTDPAPHTWGDPEWTWSEDYTGASAEITCEVCETTESGDATVTSASYDNRTCITAAVTLDEEEYTTSIWLTSDASDITLSADTLNVNTLTTTTAYALLNDTFTLDGAAYELTEWIGTITAESSDEAVATVETDGTEIYITGVSEGEAVITVYAVSDDGTQTVVGTITVTAVKYDCGGNHTWDEGVVTKEATCSEVGMITYTCTMCGENDYEQIAKLDHEYELVETVEATCTEDGYMKWVCTICGDVYTETGEGEGMVALGHTYVMTDSKDSTCAEEGYITYVCATCGDIYTAVIEKVSHTYTYEETAATCEEEGGFVYTCTECGDTYFIAMEAALGHTWDEGVSTGTGEILYTCTVCGATKTEEIEIIYEITSEAPYYTLLSGDVSTAVITTNASADEIYCITINGLELNPETAYTVDEETGEITFTEDFLESLSAGENTIIVVLTDGTELETVLTIYDPVSPQTGDEENMLLWIVLFIAAFGLAAAFAGIMIRRRKTDN